jgi:type VI secretion system protein ImpC
MSAPFSFGNVEIDLTAADASAAREVEPDAPFRILVLGDFSGRANRGLSHRDPPLSERKPVLVDRDNVEETLARFGVELQLPVGSRRTASVQLRFSELDDFHPDRLFEHLELFQALRKTRRRLGNPATFAEAAREVQSWGNKSVAPEPAAAPPADVPSAPTEAPTTAEPDGADLLAQALERAQPTSLEEQLSSGHVNWDAYVQEIVEPYVVPSPDPRQPELIASVDEATSRQMDALLHHPDFQAMESIWRSVDLLTRRLETDSRLQVYLLDVSKAELAGDLLAADDLSQSGTYKLLVEQSPNAGERQPWAVIVGSYTFEPTLEDVQCLFGLSQIAQAAAAPFLAAAGPQVLGCASPAELPEPADWQPLDSEIQENWDALRQVPQASWVGLILPRFLLRLPYGRKTDRVEQFEFEEIPPEGGHENYLWGNAAFLCAVLLGQAYTRSGWSLANDLNGNIGGLPMHVHEVDGDAQLKPCGEVLLTERAYERIWESGLMPLLSLRGQDAVRPAGFRSLSVGQTHLSARWS